MVPSVTDATKAKPNPNLNPNPSSKEASLRFTQPTKLTLFTLNSEQNTHKTQLPYQQTRKKTSPHDGCVLFLCVLVLTTKVALTVSLTGVPMRLQHLLSVLLDRTAYYPFTPCSRTVYTIQNDHDLFTTHITLNHAVHMEGGQNNEELNCLMLIVQCIWFVLVSVDSTKLKCAMVFIQLNNLHGDVFSCSINQLSFLNLIMERNASTVAF